ncbi:hypothetical protein [Nostoc sp. GT001]|uniref:hypothetical protein n=1 Tax=Nostoc sp. GT001 TaxID=3056647 RepID=UPI0025AB30C2|nr:hypothetical protein [Nostoc sp. GT001]MDM9580200.1 hypothetical protein [Nostoc sp. GT001]
MVEVRLSIDELNILIKVLNKVCNTLSDSDFKARVGVHREEIMLILSSINEVVEDFNKKE